MVCKTTKPVKVRKHTRRRFGKLEHVCKHSRKQPR